MKKLRILILLLALALLLCGCAEAAAEQADVLATTAPVAEIAEALLDGTGHIVSLLVGESVSCLHDYALSVQQMKAVQRSRLILMNGLDLEAFLDGVIDEKDTVCLSSGVEALCAQAHEAHETHAGHAHDEDPHIWLDPDNLAIMTHNAAAALCTRFPEAKERILQNEAAYCAKIADLKAYGMDALSALPSRALVTFHDGFSYFARAFDLEIAAAMEIEAGSEPSARALSEIVTLVRDCGVPALFVERNGTSDAADIVSRETGLPIYALDMGMESGALAAIRHNIDTIKEAMG